MQKKIILFVLTIPIGLGLFFCNTGSASTVTVSVFQASSCEQALLNSKDSSLFSELNSNHLIEIIRNVRLPIEERVSAAQTLLPIADLQTAESIRQLLNQSFPTTLFERVNEYYLKTDGLIYELDKILEKNNLHSSWPFIDTFMFGQGEPIAVRIVEENGSSRDFVKVITSPIYRSRTAGQYEYVFGIEVDGKAFKFKPYAGFSANWLKRDGTSFSIPFDSQKVPGTFKKPLLIFHKQSAGREPIFSVGGIFEVSANGKNTQVVVESKDGLKQALHIWTQPQPPQSKLRSWLKKLLGN